MYTFHYGYRTHINRPTESTVRRYNFTLMSTRYQLTNDMKYVCKHDILGTYESNLSLKKYCAKIIAAMATDLESTCVLEEYVSLGTREC